jgi:hypothetical protein
VGISIYCVVLWLLLLRHLRVHEAVATRVPFLKFFFGWSALFVAMGFVCSGVQSLEFIKLRCALFELILITAVVGGISVGLLSQQVHHLTSGPLY